MAVMKYFDTGSQTWQRADSGGISDGNDRVTPSEIKSFNRTQMHSGFLNYQPDDFIFSTSTLNATKIKKDLYVNLYGYFIKIPINTLIQFNAPPTTGKRTDLAYLKATFNSQGYMTGAIIEIADNVSSLTGLGYTVDTLDKGLFVSGSNKYLEILCHQRRNSSGFSPSNPSGGNGYSQIVSTAIINIVNGVATLTPSNVSGFATLVNGDVLEAVLNPNTRCVVSEVIAGTSAKITYQGSVFGINSAITSGIVYYKKSDHPQSLYANVIDARDIPPTYDLRHRVQAQYNYDYELKKASDQFMRGELSPKKILTVHHGIPKTEIDANTVFYASLDGTLVPEFPLGSSAMNLGTGSFKPMPTGSGYKFNGDSVTPVAVSGLSATEGTIELLVDFDTLLNNSDGIIALLDSDGYNCVYIRVDNTGLVSCGIFASDHTTGDVITFSKTGIKGKHKLKYTWKNSYLTVYLNNTKKVEKQSLVTIAQPSKVLLAGYVQSLGTIVVWKSSSLISNVSISNIDRGTVDYQLPPDFISGDAIIMPAHTEQRRILSESQTTQTTSGIIKVGTASGSSRGLSTSRTSGNWTSADIIVVTGMAGELISGVFDTDTALARVMQTVTSGTSATSITVFVNDSSKIEVGDTLRWSNGTDVSTRIYTVGSKLDNYLTLTWADPATLSFSLGSFFIETTATSSVPLASFMNGTTKTTIAGTWATLGTNVATFTLGTNATLVAQDIQIDYSMIMPAGQPALSAPTTTTLMGEAGFRLPYGNQTIVSDYANKISGRTWENCNVAKTGSRIVANNPAPSTFVNELAQVEYDKIFTQNGISTTFSTSVNGEQACVLLSFDLIKIAERKLGCKIPRKTIVDKVAWLKSSLTSVLLKIWCSGSSPTGNNSMIFVYRPPGYSDWYAGYGGTNTSSIPSIITREFIASIPMSLSSDGIMSFLASTVTPSDGVTPSTINVDFASLDIKFSDKIVILSENSIGTSSSIVLTDDFANKLKGDTASNPNIIRYKEGTIASRNTEFVPGTGTEIESTTGSSNYSGLSTLNATLASYATSTSGKGAGYIISWNLISEFESKYGTINVIDKVAYLKSNLGTIVGNVWTYGSLASGGNSATFAVWNSVALTFTTIGSVNTTSAVTKISGGSASVSIANMIDNSGWVHFLVHSADSDGTASTIFVDYCNLDLSLASGMYPSGYDILIPKSLRRDSGLANILLIEKNSKTVMSLFNWSNEYNLTTYSEYTPSADIVSATTDVTILAECENWTLSDISSSVGSKIGAIHPWGNIAYRTNNENDNMYGELGYTMVKFSPESKNLNIGSKIQVSSLGFSNNYWKQYALNTISKPMVGICSFLVSHNSELKLFLFSKYSATGNFMCDGTGIGMLVKCQGSPLLKIEDGVVRSGVNTPTNVWKSSDLESMGYVDHVTRKLITTNNEV